MPWPMVLNLLNNIPELEFRRAFPLAQLTAFVGNAMGGKGDGSKAVDKTKLFSPMDFLPEYARPEGFTGHSGPRIPREAAREFLEASKRAQLPSWVVATAPLAGIRASAA
jgi:hypothetical protein